MKPKAKISLSLSLSLSYIGNSTTPLYHLPGAVLFSNTPTLTTSINPEQIFSLIKLKKDTMLVSSPLPRWLEVLLTEKFFNACITHEEERKNEKNIYCLDCCTSLCPHCLSLHGSHRLLQIRRYVYQDVIRLDDAAKLVDCDHVQPYINNGAKVVFLNQRPQSRIRSSGNTCSTCDRSLQDSYIFCCLSCKIDYLIRMEGGLSEFFFECNFLPLPESSFDNGLLTPKSVLDPVGSIRTSSGSDEHTGVGCRTPACCDEIKIAKKKRSSITACRSVCSPVPEMSVCLMNRRKKTPQRAPLY